jgi:hypothetical protein
VNNREKLRGWLDEHRPERLEQRHIEQILIDLAPIKEATLHKLLREIDWPQAPLVEGVRQDTPENLERTLTALTSEYERNPKEARQAVLTARQHAEWSLRRAPDDAARQETLLWLRTWLENPAVFPTWVKLRRNATGP